MKFHVSTSCVPIKAKTNFSSSWLLYCVHPIGLIILSSQKLHTFEYHVILRVTSAHGWTHSLNILFLDSLNACSFLYCKRWSFIHICKTTGKVCFTRKVYINVYNFDWRREDKHSELNDIKHSQHSICYIFFMNIILISWHMNSSHIFKGFVRHYHIIIFLSEFYWPCT
jgi:hypothetical protein